ncbi:aldehyde dehydrogenase family protein [Pseudonocardia alni]|uniref:aldehyde dehydrogenase family protein n=1 Tax=Pseudonocardia alni TaxID=33907 RepID=UPI001AD691C7|nr:aldehyde dehydrogenase family protein [Pseudonocardia alni]
MSVTTRALTLDPDARTADQVAMFVDGQFVPAAAGATFPTVDPNTGRTIAEVPRADGTDVDRAVAAAKRVAVEWQFTDAMARAALLRNLAALVTEHADELARLEALDSGHYLAKASELMGAIPLWLDYWASLADKVGGRTIEVPGNKLSFTLLEPLGVTAHIVPWNYPLLIMVRSCAPALALGNTCVVKPAEDTSLSALKFAELVKEAGFPDGVFNVVTGFGTEAGASLAAHPDVAGITFTGSTETGKTVAKLGADHVAQVNLELGGKSPTIVFPDADLDDAVEAAVQGFCSHTGQVCVAGTRLFVHADVRSAFLEKLTARLEQTRVGDGFAEGTQMGPLVSQKQYDRVRDYIEIGKTEGTLHYGGGRPAGAPEGGYFVEPTVFVDVAHDARIAREEIFGPVASVHSWSTEDELVEAVNDSIYGLFAVLLGSDIKKLLSTARRLQVGGVMINDWFGELPMTPHGGHKQSGTGREEGLEAVHGYTQVKHISVNLDPSLRAGSDWAGAPL